MATRPLKCPNCGAKTGSESVNYCSYCGSALTERLGPDEQRRSRFEAMERHPSFAKLMRREPKTTGHALSHGFGVVFGLVFVAIALVMFQLFGGVASAFDGFPSSNGPPIFFRYFPLLFVAFGIFFVIKMLTRTTKLVAGDTQRKPAIVVDKRTEVSGSSDSHRTYYYLILEDPDGQRAEHAVGGNVMGSAAPGDIGIAYFKSDLLVDFSRVPV